MKKHAKIIILPTDKASKLGLTSIKGDKLSYGNLRHAGAQHLYLISDDEIKEGDWFINIEQAKNPDEFGNGLYQHTIEGYNVDKDYLKKVIASTDYLDRPCESAWDCVHGCSTGDFETSIPCIGKREPQIPESFIKSYVEANGKIDEVMVEYEEILIPDMIIEGSEKVIDQLKLTDNNEVVINFVEVDWKEEFEKCKKSAYYFATNYLTINGEAFKTNLSEEEFNSRIYKLNRR